MAYKKREVGARPRHWDVCWEETGLRRGSETRTCGRKLSGTWKKVLREGGKGGKGAHLSPTGESPEVPKVPSLRNPEQKLLFGFNATLCFILFVLLSPK